MTDLPRKIVVATGNPGKISEVARLLDGLDVELVVQSELGVSDADETGTSFAGNSLIKARHACNATGLPAIADDSGLAVDVLGGRPGVYSARYAGANATDDENIDKLLAELAGVGNGSRGAAFHCVATFVVPGEAGAAVSEGIWRGTILKERQGNGGFGYDPIFLDPASGLSSAQLTPQQKNARSHRGQALRGLVEQIKKRFQ